MKIYVIVVDNIYDYVSDIVCYCDSLDDALIEQKRLQEKDPYLNYKIRLIEKYWHYIIYMLISKYSKEKELTKYVQSHYNWRWNKPEWNNYC